MGEQPPKNQPRLVFGQVLDHDLFHPTLGEAASRLANSA